MEIITLAISFYKRCSFSFKEIVDFMHFDIFCHKRMILRQEKAKKKRDEAQVVTVFYVK